MIPSVPTTKPVLTELLSSDSPTIILPSEEMSEAQLCACGPPKAPRSSKPLSAVHRTAWASPKELLDSPTTILPSPETAKA